ncbi:DUF6941 family protein [Planctomycetota bacterium]
MPADTMIKCNALIVCGGVTKDPESNTITLINIFKKVCAPKLPVTVNDWWLYFSVYGGRGKYDIEVVITHPDGVKSSGFNQVINFDELSSNYFTPAGQLQGLELTQEGKYIFDLYAAKGDVHEKLASTFVFIYREKR